MFSLNCCVQVPCSSSFLHRFALLPSFAALEASQRRFASPDGRALFLSMRHLTRSFTGCRFCSLYSGAGGAGRGASGTCPAGAAAPPGARAAAPYDPPSFCVLASAGAALHDPPPLHPRPAVPCPARRRAGLRPASQRIFAGRRLCECPLTARPRAASSGEFPAAGRRGRLPCGVTRAGVGPPASRRSILGRTDSPSHPSSVPRDGSA